VLLTMRTIVQFVVVFAFLCGVNSSPQFGWLKKIVQKRLLKLSPCGEGVKPLSCKCEDGDEFTLGEGLPACIPTQFESCTCPGGDTVQVNLRESLKAKLLEKSPCGEDVAPVSCLCEDGAEIVPFTEGEEGKCSAGWPQSCECPDGSSHELWGKFKEIKEKVKEKILSKSPCGAGIKPSECTCENGDTFTPLNSDGPKYPCEGLPSSCTCPNGETFDLDSLSGIVQAFTN